MTQPTTSPCATDTEIPPLAETTLALNLISSEVGHELVHTLNYLRFLLQNSKGSSVPSEVVDFATPEIERLEGLIAHLRQFKLPTPELTNIALAEIINQSLSLLHQASVKAQVTWALEVPRHLCVYADAAYLATALRCMAKHSIENAPPGSTITVRAAASNAAYQESVLIEVIDCGPPLADANPAGLFNLWVIQPFESQTARRAFAHRLLRDLSGTLAYEYAGGCTTFRLSLPIARGEAR